MTRRVIALIASAIAISAVPAMVTLAAVGYTTSALWYAVASLAACLIALTTLPVDIGD